MYCVVILFGCCGCDLLECVLEMCLVCKVGVECDFGDWLVVV